MYSFPDLESVCCSMSSSNYWSLTCLQISQESDTVVWYAIEFKCLLTIVSCAISEKAMASHSGTLAWKTHGWRSLVGCIQSMRWLSWTRLSDFTFTFHFHALEKELATHSSVLAWRIPEKAESGRLLSMGSHRVGHD